VVAGHRDEPVVPVDEVELEPVALVDRGQAGAFDRRDMDEGVGLAGVAPCPVSQQTANDWGATMRPKRPSAAKRSS